MVASEDVLVHTFNLLFQIFQLILVWDMLHQSATLAIEVETVQ